MHARCVLVENMFRDAFQSGVVSIFCSLGDDPFRLWHVASCGNSPIARIVTDEHINGAVAEIRPGLKYQECSHCVSLRNNVETSFDGDNVCLKDCYMSCPAASQDVLGIHLPILGLIVKNVSNFKGPNVVAMFSSFSVTDAEDVARNRPSIITMALKLDEDWNLCNIDLSLIVKRAWGTNFVEALRVTIHSTCRLRRIFFADKLYPEKALPAEFKLIRTTPDTSHR